MIHSDKWKLPVPILIEDGEVFNPKFPMRDHEKQEECKHIGFKLFLKCRCSLTLGENSLDEVIEILTKEKERLQDKKTKVVLL